ncbi:DUF2971 domain-containing protein [Sinorhizobium meliloti]|uniref:DUF2971 domain-containing protein n=1 Tax=Rhizobium meliloti TaxID=382 RepID=UPI0004853FDC|nr:DUF2971 domain-containing protein [Sinorhizobium meliloti]
MPIDTNHPNFPAPANEVALWRYSNLPKLLSLLVTKTLFLPSLKLLRRDDPFEGAMSQANRRLATSLSSDDELAKRYFGEHFPDLSDNALVNFKAQFIGLLNGEIFALADKCFASCWHARTRESAALWKLYAETQAGVAISSSVEKLCDAINTDRSLILGSIRYCDFDTEFINLDNALNAAFTKRDSYEHEHEVRLLYTNFEGNDRPVGVSIACEPSKLISEVVVSPYSDGWMVETVQEVIRRLGYEFPVRKSRLMDNST